MTGVSPRRAARLAMGIGAMLLPLLWQSAGAGPLRDRLAARQTAAQRDVPEALEEETAATALPAGIRVIRDVPYGSDPRQRFDVYGNAQGREPDAPVIFMVHGGGWRLGSKSERAVIDNKVARWVPKGFVFISTDYRMLPHVDPIEQARDVARALAAAQDQAASWGGDRSKFILMGHSAGAHLVTLLATTPALATGVGGKLSPWLGTIALDSAAFNVVDIMEHRHPRLYDDAFGKDHEYWKAASPFHSVTRASRPILAVCSSRRPDSCRQADRFAIKAAALGVPTTVLEKDYSHREINLRLGDDANYTAEVEAFMSRLDKTVANALGR